MNKQYSTTQNVSRSTDFFIQQMPKDSWENQLLDALHILSTARTQIEPVLDHTQVIRAPLAVCPVCAYRLEGLPTEHRCPECAFVYDADTTVFQPTRPWFTFIFLATILLASAGSLAPFVFGMWGGLPGPNVSMLVIGVSLTVMLGCVAYALRLYRRPPFLAVSRWGITYRGYFISRMTSWDDLRWLVADEEVPWLQKRGTDIHISLRAVIRSRNDRSEFAAAIHRAHPRLRHIKDPTA